MQELARGVGRHGSCGRGVAQAQLDAERGAVASLRVRDLFDDARLATTLRAVWRAKIDLGEQLVDARPDDPALRRELDALKRSDFLHSVLGSFRDVVRRGDVRTEDSPRLEGAVVLEGAQGVLLDRDYGFFPYVTPSRTTFANAAQFLGEYAPEARVVRVGLLRAYATRHGAGPLLTEDAALGAQIPDLHNGTHPWQGAFRLGWFDLPAARYALRVAARTGPVDALVVTNADRMVKLDRARAAVAYSLPGAGETIRDFPSSSSKVPAADDPERTALARWWSACVPTYADVPRDPEAFAAWLEAPDALATRVAALSLGPTAEDKIVRGRSGAI
jgi:adenylosuccinate synthase